MGIIVNTERLRRELACRGWTASQLAQEARISPPTVSAALAGRPISPQSLALMAQALDRVPVVAVIEGLIGP